MVPCPVGGVCVHLFVLEGLQHLLALHQLGVRDLYPKRKLLAASEADYVIVHSNMSDKPDQKHRRAEDGIEGVTWCRRAQEKQATRQ